MRGLTVPVSVDARLSWDYQTVHPRIQRLYDEARRLQWDETGDIDWSTGGPPEPGERTHFGRAAFETSSLGRYGDSMWRRFRSEQQAWMVSQFLHGEQSALVVGARLAEVLPDVALKAYAASQVAEEARHLSVFARYANERIEQPYAVSPSFELLLEQILGDAHWDVMALGMQVMIESLALAGFRLATATFDDPLIRRITQLIARDEARHVSFGVLLLNGFYDQLSAAELRHREDFVLEAADLLSRRYLLTEVWARLDIDVDEGISFARSNEMMVAYRATLFARVVHSLKRVGIMTDRVRHGLEQLGL